MPAGEGQRGPFAFVQFEFGFLLGPADGRYLIRETPDAEAELVIVLRTLGAPERRRLRGRRARTLESAEPEPVPTSRATIIRAAGLGDVEGAAAWLDGLRRDRELIEAEVEHAVGVLNHVLRAHRAAATDPHARDVRESQTIAIRVGYGTGDEVADGRFSEAVEPPDRRKRSRRLTRIEPQERLAAVLGGRDRLLAAEELVLRARSDLAAGRPREAALQARIALEALIAEVPGEIAAALPGHRDAVGSAANAALDGDPSGDQVEAVGEAVAEMERVLRRRDPPTDAPA